MSMPMHTERTPYAAAAPRVEARGNGAATPRARGFLASRVSPEGIAALPAALAAGSLDYPLVDRCATTGDGGQDMVHATFLFLDEQPADPARAVILSANALVDHEDLAASEFEQSGERLWSITLLVPADWVASYRITVHRGDGPAPWHQAADRRAIRLAADGGGPDPLNPQVSATMNGAAVSVFRGPKATANPHLAPAVPAAGRSGPSLGGWGAAEAGTQGLHPRLSHHLVQDENCARERSVWMYQPPGSESGAQQEPTPLVVVHDGATWVKHLSFAESLDNAINAKVLAPVHVMFVDSTSIPLRSDELPHATGTTRSLAGQFLPWARSGFNVRADPAGTLLTGSSFGGLAAMLGVLLYPELFGKAVAQSPSLWHTDVSAQLQSLAAHVELEIQAGCYETRIAESCAQTLGALQGSDAAQRIQYQLFSGGHDWAWWAPELLSALVRAYPAAGH